MTRKTSMLPKDERWVVLTLGLVQSPAWCGMSINCRRLIDFLLCDHMNHGGKENGGLKATYDQLVIFGLPRTHIASAIREAEYLRLIRVERGRRYAGANQPSIYELTFFRKQRPHPAAPTNDWKKTTDEDVKRFHKLGRAKSGKSKVPPPPSEGTVVPFTGGP